VFILHQHKASNCPDVEMFATYFQKASSETYRLKFWWKCLLVWSLGLDVPKETLSLFLFFMNKMFRAASQSPCQTWEPATKRVMCFLHYSIFYFCSIRHDSWVTFTVSTLCASEWVHSCWNTVDMMCDQGDVVSVPLCSLSSLMSTVQLYMNDIQPTSLAEPVGIQPIKTVVYALDYENKDISQFICAVVWSWKKINPSGSLEEVSPAVKPGPS